MEAGLKAALERLRVTPPADPPADAPPSDVTPPSSAATTAVTDLLEYVVVLRWSRLGTHTPPIRPE